MRIVHYAAYFLGRQLDANAGTSAAQMTSSKAKASPVKGVVPAQHRLGFLIHETARAMRILTDQTVAPFGITQSQWSMLVYLVQHGGEGMMQTELAQLLDIGKVSIGGLLDRLERTGLIERRTDASDRRVNRIYLTKEGEEVLRKVDIIGQAQSAEVAKGIPLAHLRITREVLSRMKARITDLQEVAGRSETAD